MTPERWQQVKDLLRSALEHEPEQRAAFLDQVCAGDLSLREEVESLITSHEELGSYLDVPVLQGAPESLVDDAPEALQGRRIGPYQIVREIGRGGMGAVYLATRTDGISKQVAIKVIKRGMDTDAILRRFRHEQQILATLDHPHMARFLDAGITEDGRPYYIMDYIDGLPIDLYCDTRKLPTVERLKLFRTICSAVHYAHQHQVVHRDIKPSNILVTADGVPKLLDFGIAKVLNPEGAGATAGAPTTAFRPMTPEYASPEQVRGGAVTPASDVYSLGVLLYGLLTGHRPYRVQGHTPHEIEHVICEAEPEPPSTVIGHVEEVPGPEGGPPVTLTPAAVSETREGPPEKLRRRLAGDLDNIVLMALRKEPERRYPSVEQFSEDLRHHLEGLPVLARKDTLRYRSAKFIKRHPAGVMMAALAVIMMALLSLALYHSLDRGPMNSIAVLPFVNVDGDANLEYLSDGITESLISSLSQVPNFAVIARASVFRYKGRAVDPQAIGGELKVQAVLIGRIIQRGEHLFISTELVDARNNQRLWGQQYQRPLSDIFRVQEEISREISDKLRLRLSRAEKQRLTKRYTENAEAYQLYLKGRYYRNRTPSGLKEAIKNFEQAIGEDRNYALAYAGLADCYSAFATWESGTIRPKDVMPKANAAAMRALAIDETLAEAHASLAYIRLHYDWDWPQTEKELKRAIELNPNYPTAHHWYSHYLMTMGRTQESLSESLLALKLDPLGPIIIAHRPWHYYYARQYDQDIECCRKALEVDPNSFWEHFELGRAYEQKAMFEEAIAELSKANALATDMTWAISGLGHAYAVAGKRAEAQKLLDQLMELSKQRYVSPSDIALIYAGLDEKDQALIWLEKAYQERSWYIVLLRVDPRLDKFRSDPRFADLLRRIGLPPNR